MKFRIIVMDELDQRVQHSAKSEIAEEIVLRLRMLGWEVSLRDERKHNFNVSEDSKGQILVDVLDAH